MHIRNRQAHKLLPEVSTLFFLKICRFAQQDLAVRNIRYSDNSPWSFKKSSFVVSRRLLREIHTLRFSVILTLRTYALYGRNKHLLTWMIIIGLAFGGGASVRVCIQFWILSP